MRKMIAMAAVMSLASVAMAVPYASGVSQSGSDVSFILNQQADVQIVFDGGAATLDLGNIASGTHSFDMSGYSSWEIKCSADSLGEGYTQYSDNSNVNNQYYSPMGVAINRNSASQHFGSVYITNSANGTSGLGRTTTTGLYIVGADSSDIYGQGDNAYDGGVAWSSVSSSPRRPVIGEDDTVYIADWSDGHPGVWRAAADGSGTFDQLLANETNVNDGSGGLYDNHGSINSVAVKGSGDNTKLYTLDEEFNFGTIQQYDIGTGSNYTGQPSVVVDNRESGELVQARADFVQDPRSGNFWVAQYRWTESADAPALMCFEEGGTEPVYNSGADDNLPVLSVAYGSIDISADGKYLAMGGYGSYGAYILDISDPANPVLVENLAYSSTIRDVAFDAAGNLYIVGNSSELLTVWSPSGDFSTILSSCGDFTVVPEPASLALLAMGGLALIRRRR